MPCPSSVELDALGRPFAHMGITGYPESHPEISDDVTVQAMWDKRHYATYIVSNLCFDAATVRRWIRRVRERGVGLPIYFGLAGPVDRTRLLNVATKIGVGESARFLSGHAGWFLRMGAPGGYNPSRLLARMGGSLADPASNIAGSSPVHLQPDSPDRAVATESSHLARRRGCSQLVGRAWRRASLPGPEWRSSQQLSRTRA